MTEYLLGHDTDELRRLEEQARALAPATTAEVDMERFEQRLAV